MAGSFGSQFTPEQDKKLHEAKATGESAGSKVRKRLAETITYKAREGNNQKTPAERRAQAARTGRAAGKAAAGALFGSKEKKLKARDLKKNKKKVRGDLSGGQGGV
jgi:hypothetical protein